MADLLYNELRGGSRILLRGRHTGRSHFTPRNAKHELSRAGVWGHVLQEIVKN